ASLLFAPKSGREFRDDFNQQANVISVAALDYADIVNEQGTVMYQTAIVAAQVIRVNISESAEVLKAQLNEATTEATKQYQVARDEVASAYVDAKNTTSQATEDAKAEVAEGTEEVKAATDKAAAKEQPLKEDAEKVKKQ